MDEQTIFAAIRRHILAVVPEVPPDSITIDCSLSDLGLNSIDRTDVIILALEELAISVPVHEFRRGDTIASLVAVMRRHA